jgi:hypothetical protein
MLLTFKLETMEIDNNNTFDNNGYGNDFIADVSSSRFVSATCKGEKCSVCGKNATNKLGEEIPYDDPNPNRHNLTAYVCREHFRMIVGRLG